MGTPADHLPPPVSDDSIRALCASLKLPTPSAIAPLSVAAEYHAIYEVSFPPNPANPEPVVLILRVAGRHLPGLKTRNEVGVMNWVQAHTTIPVARVVHYDDTDNNPIGHEFTLCEKAAGVSVDRVYERLSDAHKRALVTQLADYIIQLHDVGVWPVRFVGGLVPSKSGDQHVQPGPALEETFWQEPDIAQFWPASSGSETVATLNPISPTGFDGYTAYIAANVERYIHAIERHPSLTAFRDLIPRLRLFADVIRSEAYVEQLDDTVYVVAHRDLHFANIMCEFKPGTSPEAEENEIRITAVLDWEFAGVVPASRWDPPRAFLWNARRNETSKPEQDTLSAIFRDIISQKAPHVLDQMEPSALQRAMQTVQSYVRAIVEVCPRATCGDKVEGWRAVAEENMAIFGV